MRSLNCRRLRLAARIGGVRLGKSIWAFLFLCAACRPLEGRLRIGANLWPGYEPLYVAQRDGLIAEDEFQVIRLASAEQVISAFRNRAVDIAAVTGDEAIQVASRLSEVRIFLVCDFSNGADAIVTRPDIRTLKDLKGKRVGLEPNALGAFFLAQALESAGLKPGDVTPVRVPIASQEQAYRVGQVDALVTFDPVRSRLLGQGATSLFNSSQIPGQIVDVLVARTEVLQRRRNEMLHLLRGWFAARERLYPPSPETLSAAATHLGMTVQDTEKSLQLIELPDLAANRRLLTDSTNGLSSTLRRLNAELIQHNLVVRSVDPGEMIDATLLEEANRK